MRKKNLKALSLNKNSVSNLSKNSLTGGSRTSNICSVGCSLQGDCGTGSGPKPSKNDTASWCLCL